LKIGNLMNLSSFYQQFAANDNHIPTLETQRNFVFTLQKHSQAIKFLDLLNVSIEKEKQKEKLGEISSQTFRMFCSRVNSNISAYFASYFITDISSKEILGFIEHLSAQSIKSITIKQYLGLLKRILTIAVLEGWLEGLPVFPKIRAKSTPRASLSVSEYKKVLRKAKSLSKISIEPNQISHRNTANGLYIKDGAIPEEMVGLIRFMTNTFLRPVDIKLLQHKHIQIVDHKQLYLRINLPETKRHTGQVISLRAAVGVYKRLLSLQIKSGNGAPEDYVFFPNIKDRQIAISAISYLFSRILKEARLETNGEGQKRSLYSLRHTAITFRLIYGHGIDLLTLARNARTSVEMIEKFYSSNLKAEMNVDLLQSRRTKIA
jgi:integrase